MKRKTLLCAVLAALVLLSCLTGCRSEGAPAPTPTDTRQVQKDVPAPVVSLSAVTDAKALGFSTFDDQLVEYLKQAGRAKENFTVSPLSFKAALTMTALGAEGETQAQLLKALGFQSVEELRAWYATVLEGVDDFEAFFKDLEESNSLFSDLPGNTKSTSAYRVVNSVWANEELDGEFRQSFLDDIAKTCQAEADSAKAAELADTVNAWVNEKTNGLIPSILGDASGSSAILVNALYLKSGWKGAFWKLGDMDFTARSGERVQKPFMRKTAKLRYYRDEQTQLVSVPLQGGVSMVFVLGDDTGVAGKLSKARSRLVEVTVPMFDVETTLNQKELMNYLRLVGCEKLFTDAAELDPMYTVPLYVDDIIQKAKVHIDEDGLEAAAVTAIMVEATAAVDDEPETPEIFCADCPFSFYVLKDGASPELLFWGQIVN